MTLATGTRDATSQRRLVELEGVIQGGLTSFVEVGEALLEIRGSRLYRFTHGTFEDYCKGRWGFTQQRGSQLMQAAEVIRALPDETTTMVVTERQARALRPVLLDRGPEAAAAVFAEATDRTNGHPSAAAITAAAYPPEELPIDEALWDSLMAVIDAIEGLAGRDAASIAATVPSRRRAATAKRLRKLGTYLGRIAWTLEGSEEPS